MSAIHARDCAYVTSDGPAPCTCGHWHQQAEQQSRIPVEDVECACGLNRASCARHQAAGTCDQDDDLPNGWGPGDLEDAAKAADEDEPA